MNERVFKPLMLDLLSDEVSSGEEFSSLYLDALLLLTSSLIEEKPIKGD